MAHKTKKKPEKTMKDKHKKNPVSEENLTGISTNEKESVQTEGIKPDQAAATEIEKRLAELNDKYIRLLAEYDNYRKRTAREFEDIIKRGAEKLIIELLPILDNLDRATEHKNDKTTYDEYIKGIAMIEEQFRAILSRAGLEPLNAEGKPFDPNLHDALLQIESDKHKTGMVTSEVEKGYMFEGKVIRHSKVIVSK
ncbi:MAG: nucleotide exchange factor GrpE [Candidatus Latescibacteria bacterium]|nr:nucleotide exchange factor GrpE [Candidatus Latescibacterota bacterium]